MIIGIAGKMGAGKDYLAKEFNTHAEFKVLHFADGVYDIARKIFNMDLKDRILLQQIGTKMREIDSKVWIKNTMREAEKYTSVVIADVRYEGEVKAILEAGGKIILLNVNDDLRKHRVEKRDNQFIHPDDWKKINNHSSETTIDKIIKFTSDDISKSILVISNLNDIIDIYNKSYEFAIKG